MLLSREDAEGFKAEDGRAGHQHSLACRVAFSLSVRPVCWEITWRRGQHDVDVTLLSLEMPLTARGRCSACSRRSDERGLWMRFPGM